MQDQLRVEGEADDAEHQRYEHEAVAQTDLTRGDGVRPAVVHRPLVEAQRVVSGHRDAGDRDEGVDDLRLEEPVEDVELADEVGRPGHRQGRQGDDQEERRQHRCAHRHAAHLPQVLGSAALGEQRDDDEQRRDDEAVVDHLQHRAVGAVGAQGEDPGGDEAELGDRRVAADEPNVGLREGHHRAVEDRGQGDHQDDLLELHGRRREERQDDAQEAVGADLGEHAGEDRQHRQRRRPVGVGHPAVQEKGRHLDQEGGGEEPEDPALAAFGDRVLGQFGDREGEVVAAVLRGDDRGGDRPDQHQQRADQRVDEHLQRRRSGGRAVLAVGPPGAEEEVERDQHQVEEEDEEQQVLGDEGAQRRGLGEQHHQEEEVRALLLAEGGERGAAEPEQRRQHDEEDVEPVEPEAVVDAEPGDPADVDGVLQPGAGVEAGEQRDRDAQRHGRAQRRPPAGVALG